MFCIGTSRPLNLDSLWPGPGALYWVKSFVSTWTEQTRPVGGATGSHQTTPSWARLAPVRRCTLTGCATCGAVRWTAGTPRTVTAADGSSAATLVRTATRRSTSSRAAQTTGGAPRRASNATTANSATTPLSVSSGLVIGLLEGPTGLV